MARPPSTSMGRQPQREPRPAELPPSPRSPERQPHRRPSTRWPAPSCRRPQHHDRHAGHRDQAPCPDGIPATRASAGGGQLRATAERRGGQLRVAARWRGRIACLRRPAAEHLGCIPQPRVLNLQARGGESVPGTARSCGDTLVPISDGAAMGQPQLSCRFGQFLRAGVDGGVGRGHQRIDYHRRRRSERSASPPRPRRSTPTRSR